MKSRKKIPFVALCPIAALVLPGNTMGADGDTAKQFSFPPQMLAQLSGDIRLFSVGCVDPLPKFDPNIGPLAFSVSCMPALRDWNKFVEGNPDIDLQMKHAFTVDEMTSATSDSTFALVVGHGVTVSSSDFDIRKMFVEVAPIFTSVYNDVSNLSMEQLSKVLEGDIVNWNDLDSTLDHRIVLYLHSGKYQHLKFQMLLQNMGIQLNPDKVRTKYMPNYEKMWLHARQQSGALVIGLRSVRPQGLKAITVEERSPFNADDVADYPLFMDIYLATQHSDIGKLGLYTYLDALAKRQLKDKALLSAATR